MGTDEKVHDTLPPSTQLKNPHHHKPPKILRIVVIIIIILLTYIYVLKKPIYFGASVTFLLYSKGPRAKETKIKNKKYIDKKEKNKDINPQTEKKRK